MGLALDEPKENDSVYALQDVTFLVDKGLLDQCGGIKVDFVDAGPRSGFGISSTNPIGGGKGCGSSCGSSCG